MKRVNLILPNNWARMLVLRRLHRRALPIFSVRSLATGEHEFHSVADETLESILNSAIALEDRHEDLETELASGVLSLKFEKSNRAWVINKQAPNQQLWLSSPLSGPARFELNDGVWRHTRLEQTLAQLLRDELNLEYEGP